MFSDIFRTICLYLYWRVYRPGFKLLVRLITGKCELQRIMEYFKHIDGRTSHLEYSLVNSRHPVLRHCLLWNARQSDDTIEKYSRSIMQIKKIRDNQQFQYSAILHHCLDQVHNYQRLLSEVETKRQTPYSSDDPLHEDMLIKLWTMLRPNEPLQSRISRQWSDIGFQGDDPKTDFRGMGLLGLMNLLYFADKYPEQSQLALLNSQHPQFGYSFAIVGINITSLVHSLMEKGQLKRLLYIRVDGPMILNHFNETYCFIFNEFNSYWMALKPNIMQFNEIRRQFKNDLLKQLDNNETLLSWKLRTDFD